MAVTSTTRSIPRSARGLALAAAGYSAAWISGLGVPVPAVALDAPAADVLAAVSGHEGAIAARAALVHGLAAVLLAVVAVATARAAVAAGATRAGRVLRAAGVTAAGLSLTQLALELAVAGPARAGDAGAVDTLLDTVNHVDGAKMSALAVMVSAGAAVPVLGRRMRALSRAGAAALVVSALGYGLLLPALAPAAYVSLPLLMAWVTGAGVVVARAASR